MGRAARNHGGTGGHGYFPLPGERPNYNRHVINDKTLISLVTNKNLVEPRHQQTKAGKKIASSVLLLPPLDSEQQEVASVKQPQMQQLSVASDKQPTYSAQQKPPVMDKEAGEVSSTQLSTGCAHQPSEQIPVALSKRQQSQVQQKPGSSEKQPIPSVQQKTVSPVKFTGADGLSPKQLPIASADQSKASGQLTLTSANRPPHQVQQQTKTTYKQAFTSAKQKPVPQIVVWKSGVLSSVLSGVQVPNESAQQLLTTQQMEVSSENRPSEVLKQTVNSYRQPFNSVQQKPVPTVNVIETDVMSTTQLQAASAHQQAQPGASHDQALTSLQQEPVPLVKEIGAGVLYSIPTPTAGPLEVVWKQTNSQLQKQTEAPDSQQLDLTQQKQAPLVKVMEAGVLSSMQLPIASVQQPVPSVPLNVAPFNRPVTSDQNSFTQQLQMSVQMSTQPPVTSVGAHQFVSTIGSFCPPHFAPHLPSCFNPSFLAYQIPFCYPIQYNYYWMPNRELGVPSVSPLVSYQVEEGNSCIDPSDYQHESSQTD